MTRSDAQRAPRTALVAIALAVITMAAHTSGGGALDPIAGAAVLALSAALAWGVANRRLGLLPLGAAVLGAQLVLHLVLSVSGSHAADGHASGHGFAWSMVVAHLLAAIAVAAIVIRADGVLSAWTRLLRSTLGSSLPDPVRPRPRRVLAVRSASADRTLDCLRHGVARRGPPPAWHPQPS